MAAIQPSQAANDRPSTETLVAADQTHHLHPFQMFDSFRSDPVLTIEQGQGATLVDTEGNTYLDAVGGMWCTNIGLGRDEMADAIAAQVRRLAYANPFTDMVGVPAVELAAKLSELAPGDLNHVFFASSGSAALDSSLRLVQFYWGAKGTPERCHVICREDAYHGTTVAAASLGGKASDTGPGLRFITDYIHHLSSPNHFRYGNGRSEQEFADDLMTEFKAKVDELGGASEVAAFYAEPIMGSGGVIPPPADYLQQIWRYCRANGILYVSDEVVTGFGRLGQWFASETVFGIQPDIITTAKGLTSGYLPLAAVLYSDAIQDVIAEPGHGRYFPVGFTYSGHPVACAAALKNIEIIEREGLLEHVRSIGPYFMEQLATLTDLPLVAQVRGSHLMSCVEFAVPADDDTVSKGIAKGAADRGLIVRPFSNLNIMSPPLIITRDDVDTIVSRLREAIIASQAG